jgi:hypothetical protein
VATKFQVLPEVIDVTFIFTATGGVGLLATVVGASLQLPPERLGRVVIFGQLVGLPPA